MSDSSEKISHAVDMICNVIPNNDSRRLTFRQLMDEYIAMIKNGDTVLPNPNTGDEKVDTLATQVLNGLLNEKVDTSSVKGYRHHRRYWNNPSWWSYWNNMWYPYYWWGGNYGYGGYSYVGGSSRKQKGSHSVSSILDGVDIHSLNMTCDADRLCNMSVQFTKGPITTQVVEDDEFEIL